MSSLVFCVGVVFEDAVVSVLFDSLVCVGDEFGVFVVFVIVELLFPESLA